MFRNRNVVEIDAPVERVWADLADLAAWGAWNPTIRKVDGMLRSGCTVTIHVGTPSAPRTWHCTVARHTAGREFSWTFHGRSAHLFRGEHVFRVGRSTRTEPASSMRSTGGARSSCSVEAASGHDEPAWCRWTWR